MQLPDGGTWPPLAQGDTLVIPGGRHRLAGVKLPTGVTLKGRLRSPRPTLELTGTIEGQGDLGLVGLDLVGPTPAALATSGTLHLQGVTLDGFRVAITGSSRPVILEHCVVSHCATGIVTEGRVMLDSTSFFLCDRALDAQAPNLGAVPLHLQDCEFLSASSASPQVAASGHLLEVLSCHFIGGPWAIQVADPRGHVSVTGSEFHDQLRAAIAVGGVVPSIRVEGCQFSSGFGAQAVSARTTGECSMDLAGNAIVASGGGGFTMPLFDLHGSPGSSGTLVRNTIEGGRRDGLRLEGGSWTLQGGRIAGCSTGLDVATSATVALRGSLEVSGCLAGITTSGFGSRLETGEGASLHVSHCREGLRVAAGGFADIRGARFSNCQSAAISVDGKGGLRLEDATLAGNPVGVVLGTGHGAIEFAGTNSIDVSSAYGFALRNLDPQPFPAGKLRLSQRGLAIIGGISMDDMLDDGDADNPIREGQGGPISFAVPVPDQVPDTIRWSMDSSRTSIGYGSRVFRSPRDVAALLDDSRVLALGNGDYTLPVLGVRKLHVVGRSRERTTLRLPSLSQGLESLQLGGVTLASDSERAAITAPAGRTLVENVRIRTRGCALDGGDGGEGIVLRDVDIVTSSAIQPAVQGRGRDITLDQVSIESAGAAGVTWNTGKALFRASALEVHLVGGQPTGPAVLDVTGNSTIDGVLIEGATDAIRITGGKATLKGVRVPGAVGTACELVSAGPGSSISFLQGDIEFGEEADSRGRGVVVTGGGGSALVQRVRVSNAPTGFVATGDLATLKLLDCQALLSGEGNKATREENGIVLALRASSGGRSRSLLNLDVAGFDNGLLVGSDQDDVTTISLGDFDAAGANRFVSNGVAVRVASPQANLAVRENLSRGEYSTNSAAFLVEGGRVRIDSARLVNNVTGVVIRGGTVDLGGGPLGSHGRNVLWPQSGSIAVQNESRQDVFARQNDWADARSAIGWEFDVISDGHDHKGLGMVIVE